MNKAAFLSYRWLMCLCLGLGALGQLFAHETRPAYLEIIETEPHFYRYSLTLPAGDHTQSKPIQVAIGSPKNLLKSPQSRREGHRIITTGEFSQPEGLAGTTLHLIGLPVSGMEALIRVVHLNGQSQTGRLTPDRPQLQVEAIPTMGSVAKTYTLVGIEHIWLGLDHLLFVTCLVWVARTRKKLLWAITGFTLAHSFTLALSALELVRLPIPPVEAVIALSIVFLAWEMIRNRTDSLTFRFPIVVSASFGLLHGFGFAAVLSEVGLPQNALPTALLFFNVGVEVGQIAFVIGLMGLVGGLLFVLRKALPKQNLPKHLDLNSAKLRVPVSYLMGTIACFWMIERVVGFWG